LMVRGMIREGWENARVKI